MRTLSSRGSLSGKLEARAAASSQGDFAASCTAPRLKRSQSDINLSPAWNATAPGISDKYGLVYGFSSAPGQEFVEAALSCCSLLDQHYSAHALATTWFKHNGIPPIVRTLLDGHDRFRGAEFVDAILERKTDLGDGVRGQGQTDLLAILGLGCELAVVAVEGKVDESFGQLIAEDLAESLSEGIKTAHPMPEFELDQAEIDELLAYLKFLGRETI